MTFRLLFLGNFGSRFFSRARYRSPSPLLRGQSRTWACGITYTIGSVNFLFDPAQQPHLRGTDLCALFGVALEEAAIVHEAASRIAAPRGLRWTWQLSTDGVTRYAVERTAGEAAPVQGQ